MTTSEYAAIVGVALFGAAMSVAIWRLHGVEGLKRALPGLVIAVLALGSGFIAGRVIGPDWAPLGAVVVLVALLGILYRVAPQFWTTPESAKAPMRIRRPRLVAAVIGIAVAAFLFLVPGEASTNPINVGLAILMGLAAAAGFYYGSRNAARFSASSRPASRGDPEDGNEGDEPRNQ